MCTYMQHTHTNTYTRTYVDTLTHSLGEVHIHHLHTAAHCNSRLLGFVVVWGFPEISEIEKQTFLHRNQRSRATVCCVKCFGVNYIF